MAGLLNQVFVRRATIALCVLGIFFCTVSCEKEPIDESETPRTDSALPSVRGHVVEQSDNDKGEEKTSAPPGGNLGFVHAFVAALSVIVVSELGDKTFFIAAIMAMRHPRLTVFLGAASALAFMTVLSAVFGLAATIIPRAYTYYISTALFAIFGLKMLRDGYYMSPNEGQEELEEVQSDLRKREDEGKKVEDQQREVEADLVVQPEPTEQNSEGSIKNNKEVVIDPTLLNVEASASNSSENHIDFNSKKSEFEREAASGGADVESAGSASTKKKGKWRASALKMFSRIFVQAFTLTFLAEWGDRSQLTTIILAAREDVVGVTIGGTLGHCLCTGLAVLGGRMIAQRISVRTVTIIGGIVFLIFAVSALFFDPNAE
ncbi:transmembrane protein 165 isoform X1 [Frankliniella occidentalis]|uniref:GDT1 family protein n=1 Tax=Frankliniella occidentalis TaxID=133901 RepID=A0A6J1RZI6_FRAOC|nr:transmembrane protein 165 isoform X1 [Frankliniella occidentalis]XP_026274328.1 transmembrane protein 165 isoform X1 [Frankliniella occidentalis]XP_026274329.1 transmembrane protein 165 isoform X1 [Frankliniella occidentalis]XP_026274330.1 transmembrane protein 165 isoform X1 [Frankliniella occidentalis]XP_052127982.1 transmembrane protein 165 isoform X1 [Frankliniella occidentalis]